MRFGLADLAYRAEDYENALHHLDLALARVTRRNANPRDAEAYYLLGLVQARLGRSAEAEAAWAKASWDATCVASAGLELARSAACAGRDTAALATLTELDAVAANDRRRAPLQVILLRRLGRDSEARTVLDGALREDPLSATLRYLRDGALGADGLVLKDVAREPAAAGELAAAVDASLAAAATAPGGAGNAGPTAHYQRAYLLDSAGRTAEAAAARRAAREADRRWAFPVGLDDHDALVAAIAAEEDPVAHGLLGMLLYDAGRRREALEHWNRAILAGSVDPIVHRNAGLASYNIAHDDEAAVLHYERAIELDPGQARLLFERDQLAQRLGESEAERLHRLESRLASVLERDDLVIEYAELLVSNGRAAEALALIDERRFQPWEGGEGRVLGAWDRARAALGLPQIAPPASLGEGRTEFTPPVARHDSGETDYFATSLPELLLFARE